MEKLEVTSKNVKAEIFSFKEWIGVTDPTWLKDNFDTLLKKAGFKILKSDDHFFPIKGYTCFWLLAESHLAIHTFPDEQTSYVELSSCNKKKLEVFIELFKIVLSEKR